MFFNYHYRRSSIMIVEGGVGTEWLIEHNLRHIHKTLAYMVPIEFNEKYRASGMDSSCCT
jgi:transposase InsO family protein